jgi:hypothetical protein
MLFPHLAGKPCSYLNLNDVAHLVRAQARSGNPFLDPSDAKKHIQSMHKLMSVDWSYGGYLERRTTLWECVPYLERADTFLHLGVDCNVPEDTEVCTPAPCTVVHIDSDVPEEYGWGTRIIVRLANEPVYLLFAHLATTGRNRVGDVLGAECHLGIVGDPQHNGGWFPHLHVQAINSEWWNYLSQHKGSFKAMDGYGRFSEWDTLAQKYPDPLPYLRLWD